MTLWTAKEVAKVTATTSAEWTASGFSIDSRTLTTGDLFVALKGPQHDGHDYVGAALAAGAAAAIVDHIPENIEQTDRLVVVKDTLQALRDLGKAARDRASARIIAVTGSFGKTTTKETLAMVLSEQDQTFATPRSFNNHWGVPISLAKMPLDTKYGVIELGMNHPGEIKLHSQMVRPHVALITTVGEAHAGNFGSLQEVAAAKAEIFAGMDSNGIAVLNRDNEHYNLLADVAHKSGITNIISFGKTRSCDVQLLHEDQTTGGIYVVAKVFGEDMTYFLPVVGKQWIDNSLGVIAAVHAIGGSVERAMKNLENMILLEGRGAQHTVAHAGGDFLVIDESYNGAPSSMRAAIKVLGDVSGRRIAVLGDMLELGDNEEKCHRELAPILENERINLVFTSGSRMQWLRDSLPAAMLGEHNDDPAKLAATVCSQVNLGDVIMIKGSRGQYSRRGRMYAVTEALLNLADQPKVATG